MSEQVNVLMSLSPLEMASLPREMQREMLPPLGGLLYTLGLALFLFSEQFSDPLQGCVLAVLLIANSCLSTSVALRRNYLAGTWILVLGCTAANVLALHWGRIGAVACLLALPTGLAALLINLHGGLVVAALSSVTLLWAVVSFPSLEIGAAITALTAVWGTVGLAWGYSYSVRTLMQSSSTSYEQSRHLLEQLRDRQMEQTRVKKDLIEANVQLARLHERLSAMYHIADEARKVKEEFVANVSHELRTPLNMIMGFSEMIIQAPRVYGDGLPSNLLADIAVIHRNSQHLSSLIDDVLDLSQIDAGRMALSKEWSSLREILQEALLAVGPLFESKGLSLDVALPLDLPSLLCDRTRIRQVMLNLLSNAGRFTQRGGIEVRARQESGQVVVSVADTGPGIGTQEREKIFEPFRQVYGSRSRRHGGSGLGLAISKRFVEMHHGRMWLESEFGVGTTFYFSLPVGTPPPADRGPSRWFSPYIHYEARTRRSSAPVPELTTRFVVLEQGTALQRVLHRYSDGVEVSSVHSVEEALMELKRSPAQALIVNDASAGQAIAPLTLLAKLPHDTPVITCCVLGRSDAARQLGVVDYLVKPVDRTTLLSALQTLGNGVETVLLVDDETEALHLFARMLASADADYRVLRATNGHQALGMLRGRRPDVMLLDLRMPGMDGFRVLAEKNKDEAIRDIPVVVISARDPVGGPIVGNALTAACQGGLSVRKVMTCVQAISEILSPSVEPGDREHPERSADPLAYAQSH